MENRADWWKSSDRQLIRKEILGMFTDAEIRCAADKYEIYVTVPYIKMSVKDDNGVEKVMFEGETKFTLSGEDFEEYTGAPWLYPAIVNIHKKVQELGVLSLNILSKENGGYIGEGKNKQRLPKKLKRNLGVMS
jgi:hypothetical protein